MYAFMWLLTYLHICNVLYIVDSCLQFVRRRVAPWLLHKGEQLFQPEFLLIGVGRYS